METTEQRTVAPEPKRNVVLHWISTHPFGVCVAFLGALASMVALMLAFFPWWVAPKRNLSYCINPIRTPIVQSAKTSDVSVSYKGRPVSGNVTAAQIAIWNAGREPIKAEDILTPILLSTPTNAPILEIISINISRNVIGLILTSTNPPSSIIGLGWKILEHNDGALIQIVYAGATETPINLEGTIVGQQSPRLTSASAEKMSLGGKIFAFIFGLLVAYWDCFEKTDSKIGSFG